MWTKLGDEFGDAARNLSDAAFRTHVEALMWSNRRELDLMIPPRDLRRFAETADFETAVVELLDSGWWQDCGDAGYYIGCKFGDWQIESSVLESRRQANAERVRRHRLHKAGDHSLCSAKCSVIRDVTHYGMRDDTRDPGRVGTGLVGDLTTKGDLEEESCTEEADSCMKCGRTSVLSLMDGHCRRCAFDRAAA